MPRLRKVLLNQQVVFITTSVEEGLPFPPNALMNSIIESALGRAQKLYRVRICHFVMEANHLHIIAIVDNPDDVKNFMERFKTETAHAVNRLLGRQKRTIWCEGYDSPMLLTVGDVVKEIVYTYTNPAKDNLEDSIEKYPGLSSWKGFLMGKYKRTCPWIRRDELFALPRTNLSPQQYRGLARRLKKRALEKNTFTIFPNAWMEAFGITDPKEQKALNQEIIQKVKEGEQSYRKTREQDGKSVMGAEKLISQPMDTEYTPKRGGRKMWCICSDIELRKIFIAMLKNLVEQARRVYLRWKMGDFSVSFPLGLYPPAMPKLAEPISLY